MSLDVAYTYCINLTEQEKVDMDKQVRKNGCELIFALFFPLLTPMIPMPRVSFAVQDFTSEQIEIVSNEAESAGAETMETVLHLLKISGGDFHPGNPGARARNIDCFYDFTNDEQERLVKSILSKGPESYYSEISINKFLKKILKLIDPVISDPRFWRILGEFGKPIKSELPGPSEVRSTDILGPYEPDKQAKTRSRSSSSIFVEGFSTPTTLSPMQKRVKLRMAQKEPTTSDLFSADSVTGEIQNINIAFNQFKQRMTQIGNQYTGEKQEYFFEQLNQCEIDRFKALSTEKGRTTIYNVREAETMLQSEFEGFHESNSITRPKKVMYLMVDSVKGCWVVNLIQ